jgi:hypothetical protein
MAVPVYATDLADIYTDGAGSFTAIGGGAAGLNDETDYFIQGSSCKSKNAFASSTKGMIHNNGSGVTIPTDGAVLMWMVNWTPNSMDTKAAGGHQVLVGSATGTYYQYYVDGSDTNVFGGWLLAAVDPSLGLHDAASGSPTTTRQYFGALSTMVGGPTKGAPFGIDAVRYGRCQLRCTQGQSGDYATFLGANAYATAVTRRWGLLSYQKGTYFMSGLMQMGLSGTLVDFRDSNRVIFLRAHDHVSSAFNGFEVNNSSSVVQWTNISVSSLGGASLGRWVTNAGTVTLTDCQFNDMDTFVFTSSGTITGTTWRRCNTITAPGTTLTSCSFVTPTVAADTSAVVWNVATDTDGKFDKAFFSKGTNAHHAIELGTSSPTTVTLRGVTFSGFNAANANNDSVIHVKRTSGSVTINAVGCTGTVSYKTAGATVTVVSDPVTTSVHVQDVNTAVAVTGARVLMYCAAGGGKPGNVTVTATSSGTTATVTHTSHGLETGDKVLIKGANQAPYNGVFTITNTGTNTYTYTMGSSTTSPATGTLKASLVVIDATVDGSGNASDTRTWPSSQPIAGRVRKGSSATFYKESPISGTISNTAGFSATTQMIPDA